MWKVKAWMDGTVEMRIERAEGRKEVEEVILVSTSSLILISFVLK
jgi:hypothetical protein